jgi:hypothetical protein
VNNFGRRYGIPIAILIGGGWLIRIIGWIFSGNTATTLRIVATALVLFFFGMNLYFHKRNRTWLKKVIVSFVLLFFILYELGTFALPLLVNIMYYGAIEGVIIKMVYVYLGWLFFD